VYNEFIQPLAKEINEYLKNRWQEEVLNYCNVEPEYNTLDFKSEIVMDAIAFIDAKKRYFVNMLMDDKVLYNPPKVKITGFELVRSDAPPFTKDMQYDVIKTFIDYRKRIEEIPYKFIELKQKWDKIYWEKVDELNLKYLGIPSSWSKKNYKQEPTYVIAARFWNTFIKDELRPGKKSYRFSIKIINPIKLEKKIKEIISQRKQLNDFQLKEIYEIKNPVKWIKEKINVIFAPPGIEPQYLIKKLKELGIELDYEEQRKKIFLEKIKNFEKIVSAIKK
jgi:DNA polymerase elongation subunit (family B)